MQPTISQLLTDGLSLHRGGALAEAAALYRQALAIDPNCFDALRLLGVLTLQLGNTADAQALITRAINVNPNPAGPQAADAHKHLAAVYSAQGNFPATIESLSRAIHLNPRDPESHYNLGNALLKSQRPAEALSAYSNASQLIPNSPDAISSQGLCYAAMKQFPQAIAAYRRALEIAPQHADTLDRLGSTLQASGELDAAIAAFQQSADVRPTAVVLNHLATALTAAERFEEALVQFNRALQLDPDYAAAYNNRGTLFLEWDRPDDAEADYRQALRLQPDSALSQWNLSTIQLMRGDYAEGFANYEARMRVDWRFRPIQFPQPRWNGSDLAGGRILIHAEQGFGDVIQFARFLPLVKQRHGIVLFVASSPLLPLFKTLSGVDVLVDPREPPPQYDEHCPLLSLPHVLGIELHNLPAPRSYLAADSAEIARWQSRMSELPGATPRLRIGLCWSGRIDRDHDLLRAMSPRDLLPLADVEHVQFFCLPVGNASKHELPFPIIDWTSDLTDFAHTAALMTALDLVLTIDTACAHLAGALGRPVWIFLRKCPDWRWMRNRSDNPWYPSAKLFRQQIRGDWSDPIQAAASELKSLIPSTPE